MSNMTSSSSTTKVGQQHANKQQPAEIPANKCRPAQKSLTDFSIDTLIGCDGGALVSTPNRCCVPSSFESTKSNDVAANTAIDQKIILGDDGPMMPLDNTTTTATTTTIATMNQATHNQEKISNHYHSQQQQGVKKYRAKNFQCPACQMAFSNNGQLKNHVRIHTGERPFQCNFSNCNKTFTRNEELTRHKLIHSGVRPHVCNYCGKQFGRKDHLKKHVKTHERKRFRRRISRTTTTTTPTRRTNSSNLKVVEDKSLSHKKLSISIDRPVIKHKIIDLEAVMQQPPIEFPSLQTCSSKLPTPTTTTIQMSMNYSHPITLLPPLQPPPITLHQSIPTNTTSYMTTPSIPLMVQSNPSMSLPNLILGNECNLAAATTASATIQQIAQHCWTKWYNFVGLYQQKQQQQVLASSTGAHFSGNDSDNLFTGR